VRSGLVFLLVLVVLLVGVMYLTAQSYSLYLSSGGAVQVEKGVSVLSVAGRGGELYYLVRDATGYSVNVLEGNYLVKLFDVPDSYLQGNVVLMRSVGNYLFVWSTGASGIIAYDFERNQLIDVGHLFTDRQLVGLGFDEYNGSLYVGAVYWKPNILYLTVLRFDANSWDVVFDGKITLNQSAQTDYDTVRRSPGTVYFEYDGNYYYVGLQNRVLTYLYLYVARVDPDTGSFVRSIWRIGSMYLRSLYTSGTLLPGDRLLFIASAQGMFTYAVYDVGNGLQRGCVQILPLANNSLGGYVSVTSDVFMDENYAYLFDVVRTDSSYRVVFHPVTLSGGIFGPICIPEKAIYIELNDPVYDAMLVHVENGRVYFSGQSGSDLVFYRMLLDVPHDFELNILDASYSDGSLTITFSYFVDVNGVDLFWKISETNCYGSYILDPELNTLTVTEPCELPEGNWTITAVVDPDDLFYDVNTANNFAAYTITVTAPAPTPPPAGGGGGAAAAPPVVEENVVQPVQPQPSQLAVAPAIPTSWVILAVLLFVLAYVLYRYSTKG